MKKILSISTLVFLASFLLVFSYDTVPIYAQATESDCVNADGQWDPDNELCLSTTCHLDGPGLFGLPTWDIYMDHDPTANCQPSFDKLTDVWLIGLAITEILVRVTGYLSVGFVIFGGFKYMISQGDPQGVASAKDTILYAIIGLVIAISATTIITFIGNTLGG